MLILGFLLIGFLWGIKNGFIKEIITIVFWFVGITAGLVFSKYMLLILKQYFELESFLLPVLSYILVFTLLAIIFWFFSKWLNTLVKISGMSLPNRLAGGLFGAFKALLFIGMLSWGLEKLEVRPPSFQEENEIAQTTWNLSTKIFSSATEYLPVANNVVEKLEIEFDQIGAKITEQKIDTLNR